jgi:AAA family ATP:ADP antiporter
MSNTSKPTLVDRVLRVFAHVRSGEGVVALLMFACVFSILCAYYVLKTAREGLILSGGMFGLRGDELKIYAAGAMAMLFVVVVPVYGALASRVGRIRLINISYSIVIGCLGVFFVLGRAGVPIGLVFFVWLGLINMFLVAQFWSYANDLYSEEQGKRLFAIIATGGSAGAIVGPKLAGLADTYTVMVVAGALLLLSIGLFNLIERAQAGRGAAKSVAAAPIPGPNGFELVRRDRYLMLIAAMSIVANLVNTTGEYILSSFAADHAASVVSAAAHADLAGAARDAAISADRREVIKEFYANFFFWVNLVGFLAQAFLVSRIIKRFGVRAALFVLPVVAFGTYGAVAAVGGLALVQVAKVAENSTDYSLQNTVRQALWLPTSRAAKYKAKAAIDTFFVRFGDTISAILVGLGLHQLGLDARELSVVNIVLVGVWLTIAAGVARRHRALVEPATTRIQDDSLVGASA